MFTSFFNTSKPVHFVIAGIFLFALLTVYRFSELVTDLTFIKLFNHLGIYIVILGSLLVFAFLVDKNNLTHKNSYKILFFCLLFAVLPWTFLDNNIIVAALLVTLALRRIVSLRNNLRIKKKLFDSAFWITIASLFYFWSILFLLLILFALMLFSIGQIKNWIVPISGVAVVGVIVASFNIITTNSFGDISTYVETIGFDFTPYNHSSYITSITIFFSFGIWALLYYLGSLRDKTRVSRPAFISIVIALVIAFVIIAISPEKNGSEFIFAIAPMAIIMSNYIELIKGKWFAEVYIWLIALTPVVLWVISFGSKS